MPNQNQDPRAIRPRQTLITEDGHLVYPDTNGIFIDYFGQIMNPAPPNGTTTSAGNHPMAVQTHIGNVGHVLGISAQDNEAESASHAASMAYPTPDSFAAYQVTSRFNSEATLPTSSIPSEPISSSEGFFDEVGPLEQSQSSHDTDNYSTAIMNPTDVASASTSPQMNQSIDVVASPNLSISELTQTGRIPVEARSGSILEASSLWTRCRLSPNTRNRLAELEQRNTAFAAVSEEVSMFNQPGGIASGIHDIEEPLNTPSPFSLSRQPAVPAHSIPTPARSIAHLPVYDKTHRVTKREKVLKDNRIAARKSRERKSKATRDLQQKGEELQEQNLGLKNNLQLLEMERKRLRGLIAEHIKGGSKCSEPLNSPANNEQRQGEDRPELPTNIVDIQEGKGNAAGELLQSIDEEGIRGNAEETLIDSQLEQVAHRGTSEPLTLRQRPAGGRDVDPHFLELHLNIPSSVDYDITHPTVGNDLASSTPEELNGIGFDEDHDIELQLLLLAQPGNVNAENCDGEIP